MKKAVIWVVLLALLLCACGGESAVVYKIDDSQLFTEKEIRAAMDEVKSQFDQNLGKQGCVLLSLSYEEEATQKEMKLSGGKYEGQEIIVVVSDFYVGEEYGLGPLTPGQTYKNYTWILTRNLLGQWTVQDGGYA